MDFDIKTDFVIKMFCRKYIKHVYEWDVRQNVGLITAINFDVEYVHSNYGHIQELFCHCARQHSKAIQTESDYKEKAVLKQ